MIFLDSFSGFLWPQGTRPYALPRVNQNPMDAGVHCSLQGRIAAVDCIGILQCTKSYVHDTKPQDYRVFEIIAAAGLVMSHFVLIYGSKTSFGAY